VNLIDVTRELGTEQDCLAFLEKQRWPDGVVRCPVCGCDQVSRITRKSVTKNKRTAIYQCLEKTCKQQFSATSGTIFNDSHLPLTTWFMAIALIVDAKKGISAKQVQAHLGIGSYKTAWYLCHRIRKAMADNDSAPMTGVVEVDETYIGGTSVRRFKRARKAKPAKEMVLAMRERSSKGTTGRVRYFHIPDGKRATIQPILEKHLADNTSRIYTDDSAVYDFAVNPTHASKHRKVNHSKEWVVRIAYPHQSSFSLLKRGLIGSFHRVSIKHLHRYLSEFEYRFNARCASHRFEMAVGEMVTTKPMQFKELTA